MMPTYDETDDLGYRKIVDARDLEIRALKAEIEQWKREVESLKEQLRAAGWINKEAAERRNLD